MEYDIIFSGVNASHGKKKAWTDRSHEHNRYLWHSMFHKYGEAEIRVGPWMKKHRKEFFLGCKTLMRTKKEAGRELHRSLERLQTDQFDLYQLHSVDTKAEVETIFGPSGAMEAILDAQSRGLLKYIGITGHSLALLISALERFDFDTVMFPFNFIFYANPGYRNYFKKLMSIVKKKDLGMLIIKSVATGNWEKKHQALPMLQRPYTTWYKPFSTPEDIYRSMCFALSKQLTTLVSASDVHLLSMMLDAADRYREMQLSDQEKIEREGRNYKLLEFTF
jgi:predicted aldo/keto reductase-like oxidoreductase